MLSATDLALNLIRFKSITPNDNGALPYIANLLSAEGFECSPMRFEESNTAPVDNLFACLGGAQPVFCFAGHTDVVPTGDESLWSVPPFEPKIIDGILYGRGAVDMKGAIAAFIAAALRFKQKHSVIPGSIALLLTGDEEGVAINGTRKMLAWLNAQNIKLDACLVGEPTNPKQLGEMMKIGRRGSITFTVTIHGKQGHVAYPHFADNPARRLVKLLYSLDHKPLDEGTAFFQPSNLEITTIDIGNTADNVIPASARVVFNIRFNDQHSSKTLIKWVEGLCESIVESGDARYEMSTRISGEAFLTKPGPLSTLVMDAIYETLGITPEQSTTGGTSDARFIKDYCPVVEFGLINQTAHHVDEHIAITDIENLSHVYERVLEKFFKR